MLFHASQVLTDRRGKPMREPKPGERQKRDEKTNEPLGFDEHQLRDVTHGDIAMLALDSTLHGDDDEMKKDPAKWVKAVMRREKISTAIAKAINEGDGWVELDVSQRDNQRDLLMDRLALLVTHSGLRTVGPVLEALENPTKERPAKKGKSNGKAAEANGDRAVA